VLARYHLIYEKKTNEGICKDFNVTYIITRIKYYPTKRRKYIERTEGKRIPRILFKYNPAGK
jgi:hypothetical protein